MFAADVATFLADYGDAVSWTPSAGGPAVTGLMIFDQPMADLGSGEVMSREYEVSYAAASWPGLGRGEPLVIAGSGGGATYKLRTDPRPGVDAVFSRVHLTKV